MERGMLELVVLMMLGTLVVATPGFTSEGGGFKWNGQRFYLKGASWFGYETSNNMMHGVWAQDFHKVLDFFQSNGFNAMRIPFYLELALNDAEPSSILTYCPPVTDCNKEILNKTSLDALEIIVQEAGKRGILIMFDLHSFKPGTFMQDNKWYDGTHTEAQTIAGWLKMVQRFSKYDNVFAADIKNEPHGCSWSNSAPDTDFNKACERIGEAIIAKSDWLIFCEGVAGSGPKCTDNCFWGENLQGAKEFPIKLSKPGRAVYSPHVYGPGVSMQPYFSDASFPKNMPPIWDTHFGFIKDMKDAAVCIGEWGGKFEDKPTLTWINAIVDWLIAKDMTDQFFWCYNADSGDTGGLVKDDWVTPQAEKLALLARLVPKPTKWVSGGGGTITPTEPTLVNECATNNGACGANADCTDSSTSFSCACKTGYEKVGTVCTAVVPPVNVTVNPCLTNSGGCDATNGICTASGTGTAVKAVCTCKTGYTLGTDSKSCTKTPTTTACSNNPCGTHGTCAVTTTSYKCTCTSGWQGAKCDTEISVMEPCDVDNGGCGDNAECIPDADGQVTCECLTGFKKDSSGQCVKSVVTVNACQTNFGGCDKTNGVCTVSTTTTSKATCTCKPNFVLNTADKTCKAAEVIEDPENLDCASKPCATGTCTPTGLSGYSCTCLGSTKFIDGTCKKQCSPACGVGQVCSNGLCICDATVADCDSKITGTTSSSGSTTTIIIVVVAAVILLIVVAFFVMKMQNRKTVPTMMPDHATRNGGFLARFSRFSFGRGQKDFQNLDYETGRGGHEMRGPPPARPTGQSTATNGQWETYQTPEGHLYYFNRVTQQTCWQKPF